jgi:hypothetical protein
MDGITIGWSLFIGRNSKSSDLLMIRRAHCREMGECRLTYIFPGHSHDLAVLVLSLVYSLTNGLRQHEPESIKCFKITTWKNILLWVCLSSYITC